MESKFSECSGMSVEVGSIQSRLGECLGEGAEGAVYELERRDDRVVKIFKEDKRDHKCSKLETMVQDSLISPADQPDVPWTAWPLEIVSQTSDGSFLGYMMPYLDTDQHIDAQRYASQNLRWDESKQRERYKPAVNLALTVYWLHQNGYAIGDLSEQNIRVNDGTVTLIDCDSYSIEGSDFAGQMEAPRYTPPEGRGTTHEEVRQTDQFGVTVHIFQFLMAGFHPYQAVGEDAVDGSIPQAIQQGEFPYGRSRSPNVESPPRAPDFTRFPTSVRRGFEQCFSTGQHDPSARPSLEKWLAILSEEGGFDIGGIDSSDVTVEDEKPEKMGRNWQRDIRRSNSANDTSAVDMSTTRTPTTTTTTDDTHWADNLRDQQPANQQSAAQQSANQQSAAQQSSTGLLQSSAGAVLVVGMLVLTLLALILLLSV